jgi:hypothetical protein
MRTPKADQIKPMVARLVNPRKPTAIIPLGGYPEGKIGC